MTLCPAGTEVLTVEYKVNFLAPAKGSEVVAIGRVIKPGRTLIVCSVDVDVLSNGVATRCAMVQQTMMAIAPRG
jgi:acyl-coenzyme A thioesterase PaaI-like protein